MRSCCECVIRQRLTVTIAASNTSPRDPAKIDLLYMGWCCVVDNTTTFPAIIFFRTCYAGGAKIGWTRGRNTFVEPRGEIDQ